MENQVFQTPEEEELQKKLTELDILRSNLVQKEFELIAIKSELNAFQNLYMQTVGVRLIEIDELDAKIAEKLAIKYPEDKNAVEAAESARVKADDTKRTASFIDDDAKRLTHFSPSSELKKLYYDVAKQIHPDLSKNNADKKKREELMKRANEAFQNNDEVTLKEILSDWTCSPESIEGEGIGVELVRLIRQIKSVNKRLSEIEIEMNEMKSLDIYVLKEKVDDSQINGMDLIKDMINELDKIIMEKRKELLSLE